MTLLLTDCSRIENTDLAETPKETINETPKNKNEIQLKKPLEVAQEIYIKIKTFKPCNIEVADPASNKALQKFEERCDQLIYPSEEFSYIESEVEKINNTIEHMRWQRRAELNELSPWYDEADTFIFFFISKLKEIKLAHERIKKELEEKILNFNKIKNQYQCQFLESEGEKKYKCVSPPTTFKEYFNIAFEHKFYKLSTYDRSDAHIDKLSSSDLNLEVKKYYSELDDFLNEMMSAQNQMYSMYNQLLKKISIACESFGKSIEGLPMPQEDEELIFLYKAELSPIFMDKYLLVLKTLDSIFSVEESLEKFKNADFNIIRISTKNIPTYYDYYKTIGEKDTEDFFTVEVSSQSDEKSLREHFLSQKDKSLRKDYIEVQKNLKSSKWFVVCDHEIGLEECVVGLNKINSVEKKFQMKLSLEVFLENSDLHSSVRDSVIHVDYRKSESEIEKKISDAIQTAHY